MESITLESAPLAHSSSSLRILPYSTFGEDSVLTEGGNSRNPSPRNGQATRIRSLGPREMGSPVNGNIRGGASIPRMPSRFLIANFSETYFDADHLRHPWTCN